MSFEITELISEKSAACRMILDALPHWFGIQDAKERYIRDVGDLPLFGCVQSAQVVGLLALKLHGSSSAEIHVMGIMPEYFRQGLGTRLIRYSERYAVKRGARYLTVKTLSPSREDAYYEGTRKFYQSNDFVPLMDLVDHWGPDNPCLLMIKNIG